MSLLLHRIAPVARYLPGSAGVDFAFMADRAQLDRGIDPPHLERTVALLLAQADALVEAEDISRAVPMLVKVFALTHHLTVRDDPARFLPLFNTSLAMRRIRQHSESHRRKSPRPLDIESLGRPPRVLVLAHKSFGFIRPVIELLEADGFEVRTVDLADSVAAIDLTLAGIIWRRLARVVSGPPKAMESDVTWADAVFVEWGHHALAWASTVDFGDARVIARFHRFEALAPFVHLTDYERIDEIVFVAEHMRTLVRTLVPHLERRVETRVISNVMHADRFALDKLPGAEWTLMLVGWNRPVKDVTWALQVLTKLRENDRRYRLLLVGDEPSASAQLVPAQLKRTGAVEILGRRTDMPEVFRRAGVIVSASQHEGSHESIAEGAASAAVPVVRDWPIARQFGGAETVYPQEWIVPDVESAVMRIVETREDTSNAAGRAAAQWIKANRDPMVSLGEYRNAITGAAEARD